jgi:hypothetical protein
VAVVNSGGSTRPPRAAGRLPADLAARYLVTWFIGPELPDVMVLADVTISRSGAGTIAELTALGKAAVLIPLPTSAGDEQRRNARRLAALGAAARPGRRRWGRCWSAIAAWARARGRPDAAERLADAILAAAGYAKSALPGGGAAARRLPGLLAGCFFDEPHAGGEGADVCLRHLVAVSKRLSFRSVLA